MKTRLYTAMPDASGPHNAANRPGTPSKVAGAPFRVVPNRLNRSEAENAPLPSRYLYM